MPRPWIKLWVEMLSDPKVARLDDHRYRRFIEVLLLAGYQDGEGELPPMTDAAWLTHLTEEELTAELQDLTTTGLICKSDTGWLVKNFSKRQAVSDSAMRMRKMRAKERQQQQQVTRHSDVTGVVSRYDSSSDSSSDSLININKNREVYRLYEEEIGTITKTIADKLTAAIDEYPGEWFPVAFAEAARNNARKWAYVEAILKNWKANGFQGKNGRPRAPAGQVKKPSAIDAALARLEAEDNGNE